MCPSSTSSINLTTSQKQVLDKMLHFVSDSSDRVFILKGYAGTGKTTLMRFFIHALSEDKKSFQLLASTGRAAKILANHTQMVTSTIHSMIYEYSGFNQDVNAKDFTNVDANGQLYLVFEEKSVEENDPERVYIVDEASMVSDVEEKDITQAQFGGGWLLKTLLKYDCRPGSKFVFVGDPCQLPPVGQYTSPALSVDYFRSIGQSAQEAQLTEIMRQDDSNGIVHASKIIRDRYEQAPETQSAYGTQRIWAKLPFRNNANIVLHSSLEDMQADYLQRYNVAGPNSVVFISYTNKECRRRSESIRESLGLNGNIITENDLLLIIQNNINVGLMNGDMVQVLKVQPNTRITASLRFREVRLREIFTKIECSTLMLEDTLRQQRLNLDASQQHELFVDFVMRMRKKGITPKDDKQKFDSALMNDPFLNALRCVYGYSLTCHKAQGGEWDHVYLNVPRNITFNPTKASYQWLYTAMTRARHYLHMVDDFYFE